MSGREPEAMSAREETEHTAAELNKPAKPYQEEVEANSNGEESNSSSSSSNSSDGAQPSTSELSADKLNDIQITRNSTNRVKLYVLCDQRIWDDRGTGHVACVPYPDDPGTWCIVVRLESTEKNVLESPVQRDTVYQRQQGTLIVWSESESCDLALSFQEKTGCTAIWDRICQIQGKDPDADEDGDADDGNSESSNSNASASPSTTLSLPLMNLATVTEFEQMLASNMTTPSFRERMATAIQAQNYVQKICDTFRIAEDMEDSKVLPAFYSIAKNLFLLNSNLVLNELLDEKNFESVVGMLEYDPISCEVKKHREFLFKKSKFREVLPIKSEELKKKIQLTYQVQYVQDVCLPAPSLFEENLLTCLTSHLFFSRAEIVTALSNDKELMKQLSDELKDPNTSQPRRRDLTRFLKEFCSFVHSLQTSTGGGREQFFKTVLNNDMLAGIDLSISSPFPSTRTACIDVISMIVDYNPIFMRDFLFKQAKSVADGESDKVFLNKIVKLIMLDRDPELTTANNISLLIRNLLDAESIVTLAVVARTSPRSLLEKQNTAKNEKLEFFSMFYNRVIDTLAHPLFENVKDNKIVRDDYYCANQMALIMELLSFCVENHVQSMRNFVTSKDLLTTLGVYMQSKHQFMGLCALRVMRKVIQQKDDAYNSYIVEKRVIDHVIDAFVANGSRYNLMNSAILEFFDYIRNENIAPLLKYTIETHFDTVLKGVDYVQLFNQMKIRYDALENCKADLSSSSSSQREVESSPLRRFMNVQWEKERDYDNDELFFSKDDEEEDDDEELDSEFMNSKSPQRKSGIEPMYPSVKRKLNSDEEGVASIFGGSLSPSITNSTRKIQIKVSDRLDTASPSPPPEQDDQAGPVTITPIQFGSNSAPASTLVSSSEPEKKRLRLGSSPPATAGVRRALFNMHRTVSTTKSPTSSPQRSNAADLEFDKPIIMKGCASLVDYDESDSDEEDENNSETNGSDSCPSSSTEGCAASSPPVRQNGVESTSPDSTSDIDAPPDIQSNHVSSPSQSADIDHAGDSDAKLQKAIAEEPERRQNERSATPQTTSA